MVDDALEREIGARVAAHGFEPGHGVSLEDCTRISREIESVLDERSDLSERYVLEVSSPGVERPLIKRHDYERFAGREVAVKTSEAVGEIGKRIEGVLRGIDEADKVIVEVDGQPLEIARSNIKRAHLVF